ncbi:unnamed protein product [Ixodes persulcatus]
MAHGRPNEWVSQVPIVLLIGVRTALKEDLGCSTAELVYGTPLRLPSDFFEADTPSSAKPEAYAETLREVYEKLRPIPTRVGNTKSPYVTEDLKTATHVFVRQEHHRKPLRPHYQGPFPVVQKRTDMFVLRMNGKDDAVALHRLKPAHLEATTPTYNLRPQKIVSWKDL